MWMVKALNPKNVFRVCVVRVCVCVVVWWVKKKKKKKRGPKKSAIGNRKSQKKSAIGNLKSRKKKKVVTFSNPPPERVKLTLAKKKTNCPNEMDHRFLFLSIFYFILFFFYEFSTDWPKSRVNRCRTNTR